MYNTTNCMDCFLELTSIACQYGSKLISLSLNDINIFQKYLLSELLQTNYFHPSH